MKRSPSPIALALMAHGYSHSDVAVESRLHRVTVTKMLGDKMRPNAALKEAVARLLRQPVEELFPPETAKDRDANRGPAQSHEGAIPGDALVSA